MIEYNWEDDWCEPGGFHTYPDCKGLCLSLSYADGSGSVSHDLSLDAVLGLLLGLPLVLVTADVELTPTPDIHALDCYARYRQGQLLDDRERWTVDDAREQWQAEHAQGRLPVGCFSTPPYRCKEACQ